MSVGKLSNQIETCISSIKNPSELLKESLITISDIFFFSLETIGKIVNSREGWLGIGLGRVTSLVASFISIKIFTLLKTDFDTFNNIIASRALFSSIPKALIIAPVIEEYICRDWIQTNLEKDYRIYCNKWHSSAPFAPVVSKIIAIIFSSFLFGIGHFLNAFKYSCNPTLILPQVIYATVIGIFLGMAKELSGSMNVPIGMHFANNAIYLLQVSVDRFCKTII